MPDLQAILRIYRRRLLRFLRHRVGTPDAWGDIIGTLHADPELVFLDIGAHTGGTVQRIADECRNRIVAFEPTPDSIALLQQGFGLHPRIAIEPIALSDYSGTASFHLNANSQTNSLLENDNGNLRSFPNDVRHESTTEVQILRLDKWEATRPARDRFFMKLDVQGAELKVLHGAGNALEQTFGIYAECPLSPMYRDQAEFWQIHEFLSSRGFDLAQIYPCLKDSQGRACQTDALWLRFPDRGNTSDQKPPQHSSSNIQHLKPNPPCH
ncbi:MAG: FkbM family methyltransferase [Luteolibacter sp.]